MGSLSDACADQVSDLNAVQAASPMVTGIEASLTELILQSDDLRDSAPSKADFMEESKQAEQEEIGGTGGTGSSVYRANSSCVGATSLGRLESHKPKP